MKRIITIGRQMGCGGREVCKALSERLGIPFYDRELIDYAANQSGLSADIIEKFDEKATNSLLYSLSLSSYSMVTHTHAHADAHSVSHLPINDRLFITQSDVIKELAAKGPCIFLGRCSDHVLSERDDVLNVFLYSDLDYRIENIEKRLGISKPKAAEIVKKTEKRRATYYNYYTHKKWGDHHNFDLTVNCKNGIDTVVDLIIKSYKTM